MFYAFFMFIIASKARFAAGTISVGRSLQQYAWGDLQDKPIYSCSTACGFSTRALP